MAPTLAITRSNTTKNAILGADTHVIAGVEYSDEDAKK